MQAPSEEEKGCSLSNDTCKVNIDLQGKMMLSRVTVTQLSHDWT